MTQAQRPDNPFAAAGVGARYASGRPYHHPRALARASRRCSAARSVERALDVACGTGMSTACARARSPASSVGADRSPEMLAVAARVGARRHSCDRPRRRLPFADAIVRRGHVSAPACTGSTSRASSRRSRRLLRPGGWVALYDHYFIGEMVDVPEFAEWATVALDRYPLPPRNPQVGDPRVRDARGLRQGRRRVLRRRHRHVAQQFVDYQLSISNFVAAVRTRRRRATSSARLADRVARAVLRRRAERRTVRFLGSLTLPTRCHGVAAAAACRRGCAGSRRRRALRAGASRPTARSRAKSRSASSDGGRRVVAATT